MKDLTGKVAVITGAASGIGLALAHALAGEGMRLVLADIEQGALDEAVASLQANRAEVIGVRTDVAKFSDVEALAQKTLDRFGKVHLLANNAGVSMTGPFWELSLDDWRWVMDVNVWGVVHGTKAFAPIMLRQGERGHILNTSSEAAFLGIGYHAPYCASKWAVVALSLALRSEMDAAVSDIGVSVLCPGFVDTQIHRSWRNRPEEDAPWKRREDDPEARARSDSFQAQGVPASTIADVTIEAIKEDRFWVFNTQHWRGLVNEARNQILSGENPPVNTWGPDLRPGAVRPPHLPQL